MYFSSHWTFIKFYVCEMSLCHMQIFSEKGHNLPSFTIYIVGFQTREAYERCLWGISDLSGSQVQWFPFQILHFRRSKGSRKKPYTSLRLSYRWNKATFRQHKIVSFWTGFGALARIYKRNFTGSIMTRYNLT